MSRKKIEDAVDPLSQRIYVVLPKRVRGIDMPPGRSAAQAVHAALLMQKYENVGNADLCPTILLECRDEKEMMHVTNLLEESGVHTYVFHDEDAVFYGTLDPVATAICTAPMSMDKTVNTVDYLPLFAEAQ